MSLKPAPLLVEEPAESDDLLFAYMRARDEVEARKKLSELIAQNDHIIRGTIAGKLGVHCHASRQSHASDDYDDVYADTLLRLIHRLHSLREVREELPIRNFSSYLAAIARNSCEEFLRRKYPQRHRLKKRLRYVLTHSAGLSLWRESDGEWICGQVSWRPSLDSSHTAAGGTRFLTGISDEAASSKRRGELQIPGGGASGTAELRRVLDSIFKTVNKPIGLDDLVGMVGEALGIGDSQHMAAVETAIADPRVDATSELILSNRVTALWDEICRLPLRQRIALLFNLKDARGRSAIGLFPLLNVASMEKIASALEMQTGELTSIWNQLPMEDITISQRLGITRQQVINLRKSARQRLANRARSLGQ